MRVLVTGITGFVGRHLAPRLMESGHELLGIDLAQDGELPLGPGGRPVTVRAADLAVDKALADLVAEFDPEAVAHLAAQSAPGLSLVDPAGTFRANLTATLMLLEALRRAAPAARLLFTSSAEVYGQAGEEPLDESLPMRPTNPYGASKAAAELLAGQYARTWDLPVIVTRGFPHAGPGQRPRFALPAFARQIARVEAGLQEPVIRVGNLEARRDFTDVADVSEAYALLLERGEAGEAYNVCSGSVHSIREGLAGLLALSDRRIEIVTDPSLLRPLDQPVLRGRPDKLKQATGWAPRFSFAETLSRVMEDWRRRVSEEDAA
ncbi:MAG: GDP-mannose 4,6-dehydratase [Candidatus Krumholzibacteriota bacterium]|nr:GDP-mannose 4,6-dehydratase [Candidatus Krumholzibacteriota bacterium]